MSRVQLALNVNDLDTAIAFYSKLFGAEPVKVKPGYANFAITEPPLKLVLLENPGQGGTLNHLGVEVESSREVHTEIARLAGFERDGLVECSATGVRVTPRGVPLLRVIATAFDATLTPSAKQHAAAV